MQNRIDMSQRVRKLVFVPVLTFFFFSTLTAQTLFTCDGREVSRADFLKAYNKNNSKEKPTEKSYRDYLELYIRYKLKVRAAYDMQLDTLPGQRTELQNFRSQIAENYMKDDESLDRLVSEVYARGQKDVHLAHIFFAIPKNAGPADTLKAYEKAWAAYNALKKGKKFKETALANSDDPAVQHNGGDIGYISVFTLPYDLETQAYSTAPGQFSKPFRSKAGYHIFKNEGERKSLGRIKIAQILLAIPPGATESVRTTARLRADSIYDSLLKGADFAQQAKLYSGDNLTYQNQGELPEFGIGKYDSAFEATAYALDKDGAISRPFLTSFGYHIIKRIYRKPFPRQFTNETAAALKQQVMNDPRIEVSRKALLRKILQQTGFRQSDYAEADPRTDLFAFTDSSMTNRALTSFHGLTYPTVLFSFPKQQYTVKEWLDYARIYKASRPNGGNRTDKELFEQYVEKVALDYYRNHLEEYNTDFAYQLTEFKEGNLLFEVMQRKIWDKASTDSAGLRNYYETHKGKYWWESSADAILFTCNNMKTAEELKGRLENHVADWKQLADGEGVSVQADSGRYEWAQIPSAVKKDVSPRPSPGMITSFVSNKMDNTVSFSYILQVYNERSPRNYRDARGFVINDYQVALEDQWIADLRKKYPVSVNERVLAGLPR
jgi:peptidyl-prolyl cis-trans isomerase SurA